MENASKAVIMAGGVLIAIAVISISLYAFAKFRGYTESSEQMLTLNQITSFNRYYESYPTGTNAIRGVDAINIYNKALDDGIEDSNISIPPVLKNYSSQSNPTQNFLNKYHYSYVYDSTGKIYKISIY